METWYETHSRWLNPEIVPVEVERSSHSSIWIKGRRHAIYTDFRQYHRSEAEARSHLTGRIKRRIEWLESELEKTRQKLRKIQAQTATDC